MNPIEAEAMLVRYHAAINRIEFAESMQERWALLDMVIHPSEDFLDASLEKAETTGPSNLALKICKTESQPSPSRVRRLPIQWATR